MAQNITLTDKTTGEPLYPITTLGNVYDSSGVSIEDKITNYDTLATNILNTLRNSSVASTSVSGLMSAEDKTKLNGIESGALAHIAPSNTEVKSALNTTSAIDNLTQSTKFLREDGTWAVPSYTANDGNTTYSLDAGTGDDANKIVLTPSSGSALKITVPYATNAGTVNGKTVAENVPSGAVFTDTTYESKLASNGGTAVSLVTTGEKYTWNNKLDVLSFMSTPSSSNKVATANDIPSSLPANGGNSTTVNNHTVLSDVPANAVFTDNNTQYSLSLNGSTNGTNGGTSLGTIYAPSTAGTSGQYLASSGSGAPTWTNFPTIPTNTNQLTNGAGFISSVPSDYKKSYSSVVSVSANTANVTCPSTLGDGDECTVIYANSGSTSDYSVTVSTDYVTPDGAQLDLTCPKSGYCEVNYLKIGNTIYARGV